MSSRVLLSAELFTCDYISRPIYKQVRDGRIEFEIRFPPNWVPQVDFDITLFTTNSKETFSFHVSSFPCFENHIPVFLNFEDRDSYLENLDVLIPVHFRFSSFDGQSSIDDRHYCRLKLY